MRATSGKDLLRRFGAGVALLLLAAYPLREALLHGRVLFWRDVHFSWLPLTEVFVRGLREGELPLWDRFSGFGRPYLADARTALLYPPTWLSLVLPRASAYALFVYLHIVWAGAGASLLAGRLGLGFAPALGAGLAFAASGPLLSLGIMWHQLAGAAWVPWALLAADGAATTPRPMPLLATAFSLAMMPLAGSPEAALLTVACLPFLAYARTTTATRAGAAARLFLALSLGAAWSAPQALPTLLRARAGSRAGSPDQTTTWSLHPVRLIETALPFSVTELPLSADASGQLLEGREPLLHSLFLGAGVVALACVGVFAGGRLGRCLGASLLTFVALSLGRHAAFYGWATALFPPLGLMRYPQKAMLGAALVACLLAGVGVEAIAASRATPRRLALPALGVAILIACAGLPSFMEGRLAGSPVALRATHQALAATAWRSAVLAALPAAVAVLSRAGAGWIAPVLSLLLVLPAAAFHGDLLWAAPAGFFERRPPILRHLELSEGWRLYGYEYMIGDGWQAHTTPLVAEALQLRPDHGDGGTAEASVLGAHQALHPPTAVRWGLPGSFDYDPLDLDPQELKDAARLLRAKEASPDHTRLLRIGAVRYVAALAPGTWWAGLRLVAQEKGPLRMPVTLLEVPDPLPRAYAVYGSRAARTTLLALHEALRPDFDPRGEVVLSTTESLAGHGQRGFAPVLISKLRANSVRLLASLAQDGFVVLVDAWDPGWSAWLDGSPAELLRANGLFRAVRVPAGRHIVEMRYWPPGLSAGLVCAGLGTLVSSILLASSRQR